MRRTRLVPTATALWLSAGAAWASGFAHDELLVGPYRLVAIDTDDDMSICWSLPSGDCVGDGLPGPTVFAAGYDDSYLVAAVHPRLLPSPANRGVIDYYYVLRSAGDTRFPVESEIKGPLTLAEFEREKDRLNLPDFSRVFEALKSGRSTSLLPTDFARRRG
jgi:hypothetical protein